MNIEKNNKIKAFTLVEIIVAITIFSMIMISVVYIYSNLIIITTKIDLTRAMQENVKNIVEHISEDIHKNGLKGLSDKIGSVCELPLVDGYKSGDKLCIGSGSYYIGNIVAGNIARVDSDDMLSKCGDGLNTCSLFKIIDGIPDPIELSNSMVTFKDFKLFISNEKNPKLTISFILSPSIRKGVKPNMIKDTTLVFQTTISEKIIKRN